MLTFQLTRPVWGEPAFGIADDNNGEISTHSPRVGRTRTNHTYQQGLEISTHSPRVGRTAQVYCHQCIQRQFQLTRPVWGEPCESNISNTLSRISTHSPRVGRTLRRQYEVYAVANFNSLAPCGANPIGQEKSPRSSKFQLTRPVWGEPCVISNGEYETRISTHSPRVGRTTWHTAHRQGLRHFNSLAPCGANRLKSN